MPHRIKNTTCEKCDGTGWVKRIKAEHCQNCLTNGCKICLKITFQLFFYFLKTHNSNTFIFVVFVTLRHG